MPVKVISFGFKYGEPEGIGPKDKVIDIRGLFRNPHGSEKLRPLTGKDPAVQQYIMRGPQFILTYKEVCGWARTTEGVVYIGCTGGRHRSVYLAERVAHELGVEVEHRDLGKDMYTKYGKHEAQS